MNHPSPLIRRIFCTVPDVAPPDHLVAAETFIRPAFDGMVDAIGNPDVFACKRLNDLGRLLWRLVGSRVTEFVAADAPEILSLSFGGATWSSGKKARGAIFAPLETYAQTIIDDPWMQLGAVVFVGSQARDHWNGRLDEGMKKVLERASAYESEFLRLAMNLEPTIQPNAYQRNLLEKNAAFPPELEYEALPFDFDRAVQAFDTMSGMPLRRPVPPLHERRMGS